MYSNARVSSSQFFIYMKNVNECFFFHAKKKDFQLTKFILGKLKMTKFDSILLLLWSCLHYVTEVVPQGQQRPYALTTLNLKLSLVKPKTLFTTVYCIVN